MSHALGLPKLCKISHELQVVKTRHHVPSILLQVLEDVAANRTGGFHTGVPGSLPLLCSFSGNWRRGYLHVNIDGLAFHSSAMDDGGNLSFGFSPKLAKITASR
jgi:hypothetical protein